MKTTVQEDTSSTTGKFFATKQHVLPASLYKIANKYFKYLLLAALIYMPVLGHLTSLPIRIWDESRLANNAIEMYRFGNYIVTHYENVPDLWNTKPPMMIWFQVLLMKLIGPGELAVRLPSAIAVLLICATFLVFSLRYLKTFWFGFIAILVLITSQGFINLHASRTGDYDVLLTFFTTLSGMLFFVYCETKRPQHLYLFFAGIAMAVLTKSITGLLFLPALALYSILVGQFIPLLKNKHFYIGTVACIVSIAAYFGLRELLNPGYLAAVYENDLGGRYLKVLDGHEAGPWYYYDNLFFVKFSSWFLYIPCGILLGLAHRNRIINRLTIFSTLMALSFLLVISAGKTKLEWYDVPMYPFLAILVAVFLYFVFDFMNNQEWINRNTRFNITPFILLFMLALTPYQNVLSKTFQPQEISQEDLDFYEISYYLKNAIKGYHDVQEKYLVYDGYNPNNRFYIHILQEKGVDISFKEWHSLANGDQVIVPQANIRQSIEDTYHYEVIEEVGNIKTYRIHDKK